MLWWNHSTDYYNISRHLYMSLVIISWKGRVTSVFIPCVFVCMREFFSLFAIIIIGMFRFARFDFFVSVCSLWLFQTGQSICLVTIKNILQCTNYANTCTLFFFENCYLHLFTICKWTNSERKVFVILWKTKNICTV